MTCMHSSEPQQCFSADQRAQQPDMWLPLHKQAVYVIIAACSTDTQLWESTSRPGAFQSSAETPVEQTTTEWLQ